VKKFDIPEFYKSPVISRIKKIRRERDSHKEDTSPSVLDFGPVRFLIARHFGFCYGVENAIEISFKAIAENPGKRIFLLSQMIHNPEVNNDLKERGVRYLMDTAGKQLIPFGELNTEDVVIIPAFGTTLAIEEELKKRGVDIRRYDTTCPFVERVWKRAQQLGERKYSIIIHGKHDHEETRATFSRAEINAPSLVVKNIKEAELLGRYILGKVSLEEFKGLFQNRYSHDFDPAIHLQSVGVINQTTMLASETQAIADHLKLVMMEKYGAGNIKDHFADTRDTLCYATNENQEATYGLLREKADLAIVVGGYNSSNTSHIVELCEEKLPTYFISSAKEIGSDKKISHFIYSKQERITSENFLPDKTPLTIILTSGASCPDSTVDEVLRKILSFYPSAKAVDRTVEEFSAKLN
jgi:4-hydroxy-3-methylbut-2-enyl diphosphate reductase